MQPNHRYFCRSSSTCNVASIRKTTPRFRTHFQASAILLACCSSLHSSLNMERGVDLAYTPVAIAELLQYSRPMAHGVGGGYFIDLSSVLSVMTPCSSLAMTDLTRYKKNEKTRAKQTRAPPAARR